MARPARRRDARHRWPAVGLRAGHPAGRSRRRSTRVHGHRGRAGPSPGLRGGAAGHAVRADRGWPLDRQLALLHRLHARQCRGPADAILRLLRAGPGGDDGHRLRCQRVHAVRVLRDADARHLPAGDASRHRGSASGRPHLPRPAAGHFHHVPAAGAGVHVVRGRHHRLHGPAESWPESSVAWALACCSRSTCSASARPR